MNEALEKYINLLQGIITPTLNKATIRQKDKLGQYRHIDFSPQRFIEQMSVVKGLMGFDKYYEATFVDVGCGSGTKLLLAAACGLKKITGVEYTPQYVKAAKKNNPNATIIHGDALEQSYYHYDVIYFYCPMQDTKKQKYLEEHIVDSAKSGAIIVANYKQNNLLWTHPNRVKRIWGDVIYQKM